MKKKNLVFSLPLVLFLIIGCATIMQGTKQNIGISNNPSGAKVIIDGRIIGNTPLTEELSRKDNHFVKIELDGFIPYETTLTRKLSGWVAGNIIFGGLIGLAVDAITGGMYKLTPEQIQAELKKSGMSMKLYEDELFITFTLIPDPKWEKIGELEKRKN